MEPFTPRGSIFPALNNSRSGFRDFAAAWMLNKSTRTGTGFSLSVSAKMGLGRSPGHVLYPGLTAQPTVRTKFQSQIQIL